MNNVKRIENCIKNLDKVIKRGENIRKLNNKFIRRFLLFINYVVIGEPLKFYAKILIRK